MLENLMDYVVLYTLNIYTISTLKQVCMYIVAYSGRLLAILIYSFPNSRIVSWP